MKNYFKNNKSLKEFSWALVAKGVAVLGGLFFVIYIPKLGGVDLFGELSIILAYVSILSMLSGTQINSAIKNEVTMNKMSNSVSKDFFYSGFKLKIYLFLLLAAIFVSSIYILNIDLLLENILLVLFLLIIMNMWGLVIAFFEAIHELFFEAILYVLEYAVTIFLIFYFYFGQNLNIQTLLISFIAGYLITLVCGLYILLKKFRQFNDVSFFSQNDHTMKLLMRRTFFLSLTGISVILLAKIDSIIISFFLSAEDVGYYSLASDIAKNTVMISVPVMLSVLPVFFQRNEKNFIFKNLWILSIVNVGIFFGLFFLSTPFVKIVYGESFLPAANVIKALALFPLFATLQTFIQEILILKDRTIEIFIFGFIAVIINVILNYTVVPSFGLVGAAYATTFSYFLWFFISFLYIYRNIKVSPLPGDTK